MLWKSEHGNYSLPLETYCIQCSIILPRTSSPEQPKCKNSKLEEKGCGNKTDQDYQTLPFLVRSREPIRSHDVLCGAVRKGVDRALDVARGQSGHGAGVDDAEALEPGDPPVLVQDVAEGHRADRVVERRAAGLDGLPDGVVRGHVGAGVDLVNDPLGEGVGLEDGAGLLDAVDDGGLVGGGAVVVREQQRGGRVVGRINSEIAVRFGLDESRRQRHDAGVWRVCEERNCGIVPQNMGSVRRQRGVVRGVDTVKGRVRQARGTVCFSEGAGQGPRGVGGVLLNRDVGLSRVVEILPHGLNVGSHLDLHVRCMVVVELRANARYVGDHLDVQSCQVVLGANSRLQKELGGIEGTGSQNDLLGFEDCHLIRLRVDVGDIDSCLLVEADTLDPGVAEDLNVGAAAHQPSVGVASVGSRAVRGLDRRQAHVNTDTGAVGHVNLRKVEYRFHFLGDWDLQAGEILHAGHLERAVTIDTSIHDLVIVEILLGVVRSCFEVIQKRIPSEA